MELSTSARFNPRPSSDFGSSSWAPSPNMSRESSRLCPPSLDGNRPCDGTRFCGRTLQGAARGLEERVLPRAILERTGAFSG